MCFFGNIYLLHDYTAIICFELRGYLLTCRYWLHQLNNTLQFSWYRRSVYGKPMSTFYLFCCNQKCFFIRNQISCSSYFIILNRKLEKLFKIWSLHFSYINHFMQVPHVSALQWGAYFLQMNFHSWHNNTVIRFQVFIGCIQKYPDPTCGHQLPICIRLISMFHI